MRPQLPARWTPARLAYLTLGLLALALGLVGALLPLLPTTPFLILAAFAFARSSPRLEAWLLAHPQLGPPLVAWRTRRAIPRPAKVAATLGMAAGYAVLWGWRSPGLPLAAGVGLILVLVAVWIWSRPD
ncbi:MAG: YbaN family protein [Sphingomonadaceae bacterium]|uniref:YbaN family protein n=1 Tax=Thermaurantiacus sp. TaxID=2820283 RepID=UPI00298EF9C9|nr:YbaN family protein [Thermaurantiacus sp.]MCS6986062.1 YbaN family protein [Sphingomonadaceae bacterium]MDW8414722.1 YbaN family protein [Thermaurantiacus sp.]